MVNIPFMCYSFLNKLETNKTQEELMSKCVYAKLGRLYDTQTNEYDELIDRIEKILDDDTISDKEVSRVINKLSKNISSNRTQLISLLEGLEES